MPVASIKADPTLNDLLLLNDHISSWMNPWLFTIDWSDSISPDANNAVGVGMCECYYAFSYSGKIYKTNGTSKTWTEIPYAKSSDLISINTKLTSIQNMLSGLIIRKAYSFSVTVPANTEKDFEYAFTVPPGYRILGFSGMDIANTNKLAISQFYFNEDTNKLICGIINLTSGSLTKNVSIFILYMRESSVTVQW